LVTKEIERKQSDGEKKKEDEGALLSGGDTLE